MNAFIVLWYTVMIGMPEMGVAPGCGPSSDPRSGDYSEYFIVEEPNEDGAYIVKPKSSNSATDVYFRTESQCERYLHKYDQFLREEKYGE